MIISKSEDGAAQLYQVTLANTDIVEIRAASVVSDGGALILVKPNGELEVAFGPGSWLEIQPR